MLNVKTIQKNWKFVISILILSFIFTSCAPVFSSDSEKREEVQEKVYKVYGKPEVVGRIESDEIPESSGIAASKCQENVFWTHNDSGDDAFIFAVNTKGEKLGTYKVTGAKNEDWEDIAAFRNEKNGKCFLYIGDIGNNKRARSEMTIYRVAEPQVSAKDKNSSKKNPQTTDAAQSIKFEYPDMRHDAETLLVLPKTGEIYVLTKRLSGAAGVYKMPESYSLEETNRLEKVSDLTVPAIPNGFLTGGDASPDAKRVIICDYFAAYEFSLPADAKKFDEIWKQKPLIVLLGDREQGEAIAYSADGNSILATSEHKNSPFIKVTGK